MTVFKQDDTRIFVDISYNLTMLTQNSQDKYLSTSQDIDKSFATLTGGRVSSKLNLLYAYQQLVLIEAFKALWLQQPLPTEGYTGTYVQLSAI